MNDRVEVATKKEGISNLNLLLWVGGTPTLYANDFEQDKTFLIQLGPTSKKKKKIHDLFRKRPYIVKSYRWTAMWENSQTQALQSSHGEKEDEDKKLKWIKRCKNKK